MSTLTWPDCITPEATYGEVEMSLLLPSRRCVRSPFCSDEIVRSAFVAETAERLEQKKSREGERPEAPILQRSYEQTDRVGRCLLLRSFVGLACMLTTNFTVALVQRT